MYATVQDLRDEGVTEAQASDTRLQALLAEATETIDYLTGWFFEPREMEIRLDGRGQRSLEPPVVPIALSELWIGPHYVPFEEYRVIGAPIAPGFIAPRIQLAWGRFPCGQGNVRARGTWGYTEADGTALGRTPWAIRRVCMLLAVRLLPKVSDQDALQETRDAWRVLELQTRDQSVRFADTVSSARLQSGDPEVDAILSRYVRPLQVGAV